MKMVEGGGVFSRVRSGDEIGMDGNMRLGLS